jgi:toxin co-regulated pilus biosynthesis protein E
VSALGLRFWERLRITAKHREQWYLSLSKLARDGIPLFDAIQGMQREMSLTRHPLAPLLGSVLLGLRGQERDEDFQRGGADLEMMGTFKATGSKARSADLQQVLSLRPTLASQLRGLVPDNEAMLIQAGDVSGKLAVGLENAAKLLRAKQALNQTLQSALIKPLTYILSLCALLLYFSWVIFPQFEAVIPKANWSSGFVRLAYVADHVGALVLFFFSSLGMLLAWGLWALPGLVHPWRTWLDRHFFPFNVYATLSGAYFLTALSGFIEAGLPFANAVQSIRACSNPYLKHQCDLLLMSLKRGQTPARALTEISIIAQPFHWLILVYAMSLDSSRAYGEMAHQMQAQVEKMLKLVFGDILSALMLACVGSVVYWIYAQMMTGLTVGA